MMALNISELQKILAHLGYLAEGYTPGEMDPATKEAIRHFQELHDLEQTGEPDDHSLERIFNARDIDECAVFGEVQDQTGPVPGVLVTVQDRDLGDAPWPELGTAPADNLGRFKILYAAEKVLSGDKLIAPRFAIADLIFSVGNQPVPFDNFKVFRMPEDQPISDDDAILGLQARRLEEVRIVLHAVSRRRLPGSSEYERLLADFHSVWPNLWPGSLEEEKRHEITFVARELDAARERVFALANAFKLSRQVFNQGVPPEVLYGLARGKQQLTDLHSLAMARPDQLKEGIFQAMDDNLIPVLEHTVIDASIENVLNIAPLQAAQTPIAGQPSLEQVLKIALPDQAQQAAIMRSFAEFGDSRPDSETPTFWDQLRQLPDFAESGKVEKMQFALQLNALTQGHVPLMHTLQTEFGLESTRALLEIDRGQLIDLVSRPDIGVPPNTPGDKVPEQTANYVDALVGALQMAMPTETVAKAIRELPIEIVGDADLHAALGTFFNNATSADLRKLDAQFDIRQTLLDPFLAKHGETVLAGISAEQQPAVIAQVKRAQRLFKLSTEPETFKGLWSSSYHSARDIANVPCDMFVAENLGMLGNKSQLLMIHNRAVSISTAILHTYILLNDTLNGVQPASVSGPKEQASINEAVAKALPDWQQLFGAIELCDCPHCRSVYSPAAYLVDLMHFLDQSKTRDGQFKLLDVLLGKHPEKDGDPALPPRRPDLARLKLSCENTNTAIPYVDLVNEVLESLVTALDFSQIPAYDTGSATTAELRATPQHAQAAAYLTPAQPDARARLDRAVYPLSLPYDQPLQVARGYLVRLDTRLPDLMQQLGSDGVHDALTAELLGLSPAEFEVLTGKALDGGVTSLDVSPDGLYGLSPDLLPRLDKGSQGIWVVALKNKLNTGGAALPLAADPAADLFDDATQAAVITFQQNQGLPVSGSVTQKEWSALAAVEPSVASVMLPGLRIFLERTGLSFEELTELLQMRFVNPARDSFDVVNRLKLPGPDLIAFAEAGLHNPSQAVLDALLAANVSLDDFTSWAGTRLAGDGWEQMKRTILINEPEDAACDLDSQTLHHWDDANKALKDGEWQTLNRLIRLQRKLGWSWEDLDAVLIGLQAATIDLALLRQLTQLRQICEDLDLAVPEAAALWTNLNVQSPGSPYCKRFLSQATLRIDPAFQPDWRGEVLSGAVIGEHVPTLLAGLRLRSVELGDLRSVTGLQDDQAALDLAGVSQLYRHAILARKLGLAVRDLLDLKTLSGVDPFVAPGDNWVALRFVDFIQQLRASGLSVPQVAYLLGIDGADSLLAPAEPAPGNLLKALQLGLRAIDADNQPADDPTGELTLARLSMVLEDGQAASRLVQLVRGDDTYAAPLDALPAGLKIPAEWTARLRYDAGGKILICRGALTSLEQQSLLNLSNDVNYRAAVNGLFDKPRAVLADIVAGLSQRGLNLVDPEATLLGEHSLTASGEMDAQTVTSKFVYLLGALLPFVRDRLSRSLIKQTLAESLGLEPNLLALLLEGQPAGGLLLQAVANTAQPAMADFLALTTALQFDSASLSYRRLHRAAMLITVLGLTAGDLLAASGWFAFQAPPNEAILSFENLRKLSVLTTLQQSLPSRTARLSAVLSAGDSTDAQKAVIQATSWDKTMLSALSGPLALNFALPDFQDPDKLARLAGAVDLIKHMGVSVAQAWSWANQRIDPASSEDIKRAVQARYDAAAWLEVANTLNDPLRESQKAALIAYLLPRLGLTSSSQLYEHILVDVEMSACMLTSRIKQAISSVQMFVQRCLMNLEPYVAPTAIDGQHWQWMKNYRVWEANRKVFLYPENWIEPELRDDKTPFFKELESALLQDDINNDSAERALLDYLEKLDEVAKLNICAIHVQRDFSPDEKKREIVHVFGHTTDSPAIYFYRQYVTTTNGTHYWTAWEKIPVDVQGDSITAKVWNRRLYLFWLMVTTKPKSVSGGGAQPDPPEQFQEYQLAWSEYKNGRWSPKKVSGPKQVLINADMDALQKLAESCQNDPSDQPAAINRIEAREDAGQLRIVLIPTIGHGLENTKGNFCYAGPQIFGSTPSGPDVAEFGYELTLGSFDRDECHSQFQANARPAYADFTDGFLLDTTSPGLKVLALGPKQDQQTILRQDQNGANAIEQGWHLDAGDYLIYQDDQRGFLVKFDAAWPDILVAVDQAKFANLGQLLTSAKTQVTQISDVTAISYLDQRASQAVTDSNSWVSASAGLSVVNIKQTAIALAVPGGGVGNAVLNDRVIDFQKFAPALYLDYQNFTGKHAAVLTFETLYHPYVCRFMEQLQRYGVTGLLTLDNQNPPQVQSFSWRYQVVSRWVGSPLPVETVDFGNGLNPAVFSVTAYSTYNWELFFHAPLMVATRLSKNQRFEEAMRWFHTMFDPTDDQGQYWKVQPFQKTPQQRIQDLIVAINQGDSELQRQVAEWKDNPFKPHLIARMRMAAYQKNLVMKYIDNLVAWGDQLFRQDTIESINEAAQLYIMASDLLGPRPQRMPTLTNSTSLTFEDMRGKLDVFGNTMVELETRIPLMTGTSMTETKQAAGLLGIARGLYFCIPQNDNLLSYWDTVADRLFKIRNCMNIEGVVRELPLFEPPIDPALLVQAVASGIDLNSVLSDLSAPLPHYRYTFKHQKAQELCGELKSLGAALLSALEKRDGEALAVLRAQHEKSILEMVKLVRKQQVDEANAQITALLKSREIPVNRYQHYLSLLGTDSAQAPEIGANVPPVVFNPKPTTQGGVSLIDEETNELSASHSARDWHVRAGTMDTLAGLSHYIPTLTLGSVTSQISFGGPHVGPALTAVSHYQELLGKQDSYDASHAGKMAVYQRRQQDWAFQANSAAREIMQIDAQYAAANIRLAIATQEQLNLEKQIENAEVVETFLHSKYTNEDLYAWMQSKLSELYFQTYHLAYDLAKQAERCFRFELGVTESNFIQFGVWDSLRKGLLSGELLSLQLHQMDRAYQDQNRREYELTKHVSLRIQAPLALIQLKESGQCIIELPEALFDVDYPGHYMRRIKSVSISIPAVTGPYTGINCTLTLLSDKTRVKSELRNGKYVEDLEIEDARFVANFASIQSIAASSAQNDSGMFELNFHDERYLPFEGAGVASRWRIELPRDFRQFDYDAISDVVLHIKYTAREGGAILRDAAVTSLTKLLEDEESLPQARLFSLRHEFPSEWQRLLSVADNNGDHSQAFSLAKYLFPFVFQGGKITLNSVELFGIPRSRDKNASAPELKLTLTGPDGLALDLPPASAAMGLLVHKAAGAAGEVKNLGDSKKEADWTIKVLQADLSASLERLEDILVLVHYSVKMPQNP
jgi:peptidoglycan hydrolase-like protein with peptidoglycan-binding domain